MLESMPGHIKTPHPHPHSPQPSQPLILTPYGFVCNAKKEKKKARKGEKKK
jgi:hypothetical protein